MLTGTEPTNTFEAEERFYAPTGLAAQAEPLNKVVVGYVLRMAPLWFAKNTKHFEKRGLDLLVGMGTGGLSRSRSGLSNGSTRIWEQ